MDIQNKSKTPPEMGPINELAPCYWLDYAESSVLCNSLDTECHKEVFPAKDNYRLRVDTHH